jgi:hypothetical protein
MKFHDVILTHSWLGLQPARIIYLGEQFEILRRRNTLSIAVKDLFSMLAYISIPHYYVLDLVIFKSIFKQGKINLKYHKKKQT